MGAETWEGLTASEWAKRLGISRQRVYQKIRDYGSPVGGPGHSAPTYPIDDEVMTAAQWAKRFKISVSTFHARRLNGTPMDREYPSRHEAEGERLTVSEWSERLGVPRSVIYENLVKYKTPIGKRRSVRHG